MDGHVAGCCPVPYTQAPHATIFAPGHRRTRRRWQRVAGVARTLSCSRSRCVALRCVALRFAACALRCIALQARGYPARHDDELQLNHPSHAAAAIRQGQRGLSRQSRPVRSVAPSSASGCCVPRRCCSAQLDRTAHAAAPARNRPTLHAYHTLARLACPPERSACAAAVPCCAALRDPSPAASTHGCDSDPLRSAPPSRLGSPRLTTLRTCNVAPRSASRAGIAAPVRGHRPSLPPTGAASRKSKEHARNPREPAAPVACPPPPARLAAAGRLVPARVQAASFRRVQAASFRRVRPSRRRSLRWNRFRSFVRSWFGLVWFGFVCFAAIGQALMALSFAGAGVLQAAIDADCTRSGPAAPLRPAASLTFRPQTGLAASRTGREQ
jgi:hypothetical protein